jgi:hypothetical protein|tara:strand:- start:71 stop:322 length:252 start_codon:yes stop_codon:yes gene_type:complete
VELFELEVGDILVDDVNKDVGVLLRSYYLFDDSEADIYENVIVWDIYWTTYNFWPFDDPVQCYTEDGLRMLLKSGVLALHKNT